MSSLNNSALNKMSDMRFVFASYTYTCIHLHVYIKHTKIECSPVINIDVEEVNHIKIIHKWMKDIQHSEEHKR